MILSTSKWTSLNFGKVPQFEGFTRCLLLPCIERTPYQYIVFHRDNFKWGSEIKRTWSSSLKWLHIVIMCVCHICMSAVHAIMLVCVYVCNYCAVMARPLIQNGHCQHLWFWNSGHKEWHRRDTCRIVGRLLFTTPGGTTGSLSMLAKQHYHCV